MQSAIKNSVQYFFTYGGPLAPTATMVCSAGLLHSLGWALRSTLDLGHFSPVAANLQAQALRSLAAATMARGAEAAVPNREEPSASVAADSSSERGMSPSSTDVASSSAASGHSSNDSNFNVHLRRVVSERRAAEQGSFEGIIHIQNTFNNIIMTLTDQQGFIKTYTSAGIVGFRGARRSQPVAAERAAEELARRALKLGYSTVSIRLKGPGNTKQYAVQSLAAAGLQITSLADVTPIPYNGCRLPKRRRV